MSFRLKTVLGIAFIEVILLSVLVASSLNVLRTSNEAGLQQKASDLPRSLPLHQGCTDLL